MPPDQVPDPRRFLTGPQVCARYSISDVGLWRWLRDPELAFPQPALRIRDRRYWLEADLVAWERAQLPAGCSIRNGKIISARTIPTF
jgi:predicted DNA-binding transcriptional regulator AlpA